MDIGRNSRGIAAHVFIMHGKILYLYMYPIKNARLYSCILSLVTVCKNHDCNLHGSSFLFVAVCAHEVYKSGGPAFPSSGGWVKRQKSV